MPALLSNPYVMGVAALIMLGCLIWGVMSWGHAIAMQERRSGTTRFLMLLTMFGFILAAYLNFGYDFEEVDAMAYALYAIILIGTALLLIRLLVYLVTFPQSRM